MRPILIALLTLIFTNAFSSINFVHIPKCGGTTIKHLFKSNFQKSEIYPHTKPWNKNKTKHLTYKVTEEEMLEAFEVYPEIEHRVVWGHFPMWFFQEKDPNYETSYYFTVLRDPVERVLSHYRYTVRCGNVDAHPLHIASNLMCYILCSDPTLEGEALLENAKQSLDRMDYIIFMDDYENGIKKVFTTLGLRLPRSIPHYNTTEKQTVSPELIEQIKGHNSLDLQLYEYANSKRKT